MANNNENKVLNVPHLRFPEFSGEWDSFKLVELGKFIGGGTPSSSNLSFWTGSIPWISSSDIKEDNINNISISRYITEDAIEKSATKYCPAPVILIVSRVGVGKVALSHTSLCTSQDFCNIIDIKCHPVFLSYNLLRTMKRKSREVQGTSIKGITSDELQKIRVFIPKNKDEQNKISNLLTLLDERIATQNKIIEKLQSLIKGLSQQLLSSENDWILYRLDDLAQIKSGYSGTQVSYQTPYKVSRIETISKHCIDIQRIGYVECIPESYRLNVGNILFSNINSIQYIGNTAYLDKDYGLYHGMNLLRIIPNTTIVRPRFLHLLLCTDWAINHFQTICNKAVSQASINQTALGKSRFPIPPMSVQQQICSMFELTERKLDNEQEYISCLQQQKRYLLQKMFI
ncbi:restriction endonuclease subunit S [Barnesiella intestinihominis]|uniref:restriction endonuclease subunit S n=1 Tax=Barnesiella intestinihominis TaxID=487174 RepID=UPI003A861EC2